MTFLKYFDPLVLNVPVRITKEGFKFETRTVMFRREFHITPMSLWTQRRMKHDGKGPGTSFIPPALVILTGTQNVGGQFDGS